jgi:hypothetical protein
VLAAAAANPCRLAIGVDADAAAMAEASHRAARSVRRSGLPNALFVVAAAETLPSELNGVAVALTVQFPWGSLLRGLLRAEAQLLTSIVRVCRPGASVTLLLSVTERDHVRSYGWKGRLFAWPGTGYAPRGPCEWVVAPAPWLWPKCDHWRCAGCGAAGSGGASMPRCPIFSGGG